MFKYTEADFNIDGVKIHYYRTGGDKPPFILLHGAADNGLCWTTTAEMLAKKYDVVMPDAQGHGLSDRLDKNFTFQSHYKQVAGLVKQLGFKKPVIMGHSMGAGTAVNVAIEYPSLPCAIILEDPPWGMPPTAGPAGEAKRQQEGFFSFLTGLQKLPLEAIIAESRKMDPQWPEEERLPWARAKQQFDVSLFLYPAVDERPYTGLVPRIKCPTLLIIAENGIVSRETAANAARLWKSEQSFKWVQIKGATHNIRRDNFPAYRDAVLDFLKELSD